MIIITPHGGHATVFIWKHVRRLTTRPDVCFGVEPDITKFPKEEHGQEWLRRTGLALIPQHTIEQNLMFCINHKENVLLSGRCSMQLPFLTRNRLEAVCIVRHPIQAYCSFMGNRHPIYAKKFGGYKSEGAIRWWAKMWNNVVGDFIRSGNNIYRFEHMPEDLIGYPELQYCLRDWKKTHKNPGLQNKKLESLMRSLVEDKYKMIYGDTWSK